MLQKVELREGPRTYYTQLPNSVDDAGLDPYAFRLYCHLRRVAGEYGECWQSTETLAGHCNMSTGSVSEAKAILVSNGFISIAEVKVHGGMAHLITINDIWQSNHEKYATPSPHEQAPSPCEQAPSPHETKNNTIRITHEEEHIAAEKKKPAARGRNLPPKARLFREKVVKATDDDKFWPNKRQVEMIESTVTDVPLFVKCVDFWMDQNYSPHSVPSILDMYKDGGPKPNGKGKYAKVEPDITDGDRYRRDAIEAAKRDGGEITFL